jgi:hypothetical protein
MKSSRSDDYYCGVDRQYRYMPVEEKRHAHAVQQETRKSAHCYHCAMHTNSNIALARGGTIVRFQSPNSQAMMLEATRLVAAGRPSDATAILQRSLGVTMPDMAAERSSWNLSDRLREWFGRRAPYARGNSARPVLNPEPRSEAGQFLSRTYHSEPARAIIGFTFPAATTGNPFSSSSCCTGASNRRKILRPARA